MNSKKIAIITGASAGLGVEFAIQADQLYDLDEIWLVARRKDKLEQVAKKIQTAKAKIFSTDLTDEQSIEMITAELELPDYELQLLVNNAGFGDFNSFGEVDEERVMSMIELNIAALTKLTKKLLPELIKSGEKSNKKNELPAVINIASTAGFNASSGFNVYAATKAYVLHFSLGLREELKSKNIRVITVTPGPVRTEFFEVAAGNVKSDKNALNQMENLAENRFLTASAKEVVRTAMKDLRRNKAVSMHGWVFNLMIPFTRLLPKEWTSKVS